MNSRKKTTAEQPGNADILNQLFDEQAKTEHYITAVSDILDHYEKMYESANRDIDRANPQIYSAGSPSRKNTVPRSKKITAVWRRNGFLSIFARSSFLVIM